MKGNEILKVLDEQRNKEHKFIKWSRKEDDFVDYDLIERFIDNFSGSTELDNISLLTMEEMWHELQRLAGKRVQLVSGSAGDSVEWVHHGKKGTTTQNCPYTAENLMTIFDIESKGNPVGS